MSEGLHCPITLELLEDPVTTPCCGNTFSRDSLKEYLKVSVQCPLCRVDLKTRFPFFDVETVTRNNTMAGLVDDFRRSSGASAPGGGGGGAPALPAASTTTVGSSTMQNVAVATEQMRQQGPRWQATLDPVVTGDGTQLPVGRLRLDVEWPDYTGDVCLFLPIIDKSGSMAGQPFRQVKTALMHMLHQTLAHRSVFTCIIPYDSSSEVIKVPRDGSATTDRWKAVERRIDTMQAGGGTNFRGAFRQIQNVLFGDTSGGKVRAQAFEKGTAEYEAQRRLGRQGLLVQGAPAFVKSVVICFLTDGEDNALRSAHHSKSQQRVEKVRSELVEGLRAILSRWEKQVVVHTVGFSRDHDFQFLDELRKVGTSHGTFRYADPSDGSDALCAKLTELTDIVVASTSLSVNITKLPFAAWGAAQSSNDEPTADHKEATTSLSVNMAEGRGSAELLVHLPDNYAGCAAQPCGMLELELANSTPDAGEADKSAGAPSADSADNLQSHFSIPIRPPTSRSSVSAPSAKGVWESHLVSELANEVLQVATAVQSARQVGGAGAEKNGLPIDLQLHAALLLQRAMSIEVHVKLHCGDGVVDRLRLCVDQLRAVLSGSTANIARLQDNATAAAADPTPTPHSDKKQAPLSSGGSNSTTSKPYQPVYSSTARQGRQGRRLVPRSSEGRGPMFKDREGRQQLHDEVLTGSEESLRRSLAVFDLAAPTDPQPQIFDTMGDSPLSVAGAIGKTCALRVLLDTPWLREACLNHPNDAGETPLELAALRGHFRSFDLLQSAGAQLGSRCKPQELLRRVLERGFHKTAGYLVASGLAEVSLDVLAGQVPKDTLAWIMQRRLKADVDSEANGGGGAKAARKHGALYLQRAVEKGMRSLVADLLRQGARPDSPADLCELLLLCGPISHSGIEIAKLLLDAVGIQDEIEDSQANNAEFRAASLGLVVYEAASAGWAPLLRLLLKRRPRDRNWRNPKGCTALWVACANRNMDCILALLNAHADPTIANHKGSTPLINSCQKNHCAGVGALLAAGAPVARPSSVVEADSANDCNSAVFVCCRTGRPEILHQLLTHMERTTGRNAVLRELQEVAAIDGFTPLLCAVEQDRSRCVEVLIEHGAKPDDFRTSKDNPILPGATALHLAAHYGSLASALALLRAGAATDIQDANGATPLHIAVRQMQPLMVRLLMSHRADPMAKDARGRVPAAYCDAADSNGIRAELVDPAFGPLLAAARLSGSLNAAVRAECERILRLHAGCLGYLPTCRCVDVHCGDSWTPLMEAVVVGNLDFARSLIALGADVHRCDDRGLSAAFWALAMQGPDAAGSLLKASERCLQDLRTVGHNGSPVSQEPLSGSDDNRKVVQCSDGPVVVSSAAFSWMEGNFPPAVAAGVPASTLSLTLTAQGLGPATSEVALVSTPGVDSTATAATGIKQDEFSTLPCRLSDTELRAFKYLQKVQRGDVQGGMLLNMALDLEGRTAPSDAHTGGSRNELLARMAGTVTNLTAGVEPPHPIPKPRSDCGVLGFMLTLGRNRRFWPRGPSSMNQLLENARRAAVGCVAAQAFEEAQCAIDNSSLPSMGLQHAFALHTFGANTNILAGVNDALRTGNGLDFWHPFIALVLDALQRLPPLPPSQKEVFRRVDVPFDLKDFSVGTVVTWHGFASACSRWSVVLPLEDQRPAKAQVQRKPAAEIAAPSAELPKGWWSCQACTFHNPKTQSRSCSLCGSAKPAASARLEAEQKRQDAALASRTKEVAELLASEAYGSVGRQDRLAKVVFCIRSRTGRSLAPVALTRAASEEIVILPGTSFRITGVSML
eukprot:INCI9399.2.p1 GENE.INCI9399.2~~INCI9399.2.p1  ORF type:complete len:1872 (+),score=294.44 INCI9399.2:196-5616(+)